MTQLEQFKKVVHKHLIIHDDSFIDVVFGCVFANRLDSKPVWLYLVGAPSSGKTEILQSFTGHPKIYDISRLTANTLISGWRIEGSNEDTSLLPLLDGKILIIKDFTSMLSIRYEPFADIMGQLRDAFDGTCRYRYGHGKDEFYKSKFGIIAAVTTAIDKHQHLISSLGERFVLYRCPEISQREEAERCMKVLEGSTIEKEAKIAKAAKKVLSMQVTPVTLSSHLRKIIINVAMFVARARTSVQRNTYTKEAEIPSPEVAARLTKQLADLARGVAMARSKTKVTKNEIAVVCKVAYDSLPLKRIKLIKCLLKYYPDWVTATKLANDLSFGDRSVRQWLDDLLLLKIVKKKLWDTSRFGVTYCWKLANRKHINGLRFLQNPHF